MTNVQGRCDENKQNPSKKNQNREDVFKTLREVLKIICLERFFV